MFQIANFQANAFVIVEGKAAPGFYIVRQGRVRLTAEMPIPGEDASLFLNPGDFFGVVSAMSGHPHIETAQCLAPTSLINVGRDQFGVLIQKNAPIAMKIIRYFSQRLRIIDRAITKLTFHSTVEEDPQMMFNIAQFYYGKQEMKHAAYAYQRYLQYYPNSQLAAQAKMALQNMSAPMSVPTPPGNALGRSFVDGQMVFIEHEPGNELYIIQGGKVKITKVVNENEVLLAVLNPGDIFGEMALLENKPRSASAVASGNVTTLAINKQNFEGMVQAQPQLATKLITLLSERIWLAYRQLANLLISDPVGRMYDTLLTQVQKKKVAIQPKTPYVFDIGSQEILKMLGFAPEKGEEYLITMLSDKNLRLDQGKFICKDLAELEKQVSFIRKRAATERQREANKQG
ncbi:MAG: Crp/Fnr family transcriptional regulator [Spirochaetes bacterium]|nr:Crp/Fnr family transcriptional regulator [Spirochaetota bacterium]